ncbi:hypothetical protein B0A58_10125 [Flavobacterium branchiophilum NBRC 15030 = ATCC 35035]|uniref:Uncharacterized protein YegJ (DUF2314 family) n=1 Tax=Flavobacterium branchiophilum TaxID=55197 RepID=A0A543G799_9FLAO|nr:DUF2314 domain-containing protein [Flavobacterium branchiophilum]OXA74736.1 hypothetical protein B0A58_10125 [Flavobacterium branchiophilum NBRC 15030 = ATCC 35035]TQM41958.1 uncharacterized protein YegJ (DUF2314 family) [Flavobacterium branchiophilum]GEM55055.1 putative ankyrin repeat protein [Flavobacterium branchiophilum NBRC 15030 = ATCC 35035]
MTDKEIFFADGNNPNMIEAFKNAQETFKYFWRELSWEYRRIIPALTVACVKIAFTQDTDNGQIVEHMWINDVQFDGSNVKGTLVNSPNELTNVSNGDFVNIPLNQISDRLFATYSSQKPKKGLSKLFSSTPKPVTYGGFTIQVMRSEMTNQERKEHDSAWGLDFGDFNEILLVNEQKENPENLIEHPMSKNMREKLIEFLKEHSDEITNRDEYGLTLLHKETIAGNLTSVEVLLSNGAHKNIKSNQGETALDFANKMNWQHIIPVLEK